MSSVWTRPAIAERELSPDEVTERYLAFLRVFSESFPDERKLRASRMTSFLHVAHHRGCSQIDIEQAYDETNRKVSEDITFWEEEGFVSRRPNPSDRRYKLLDLTPSGLAFFDRLSDAISGRSEPVHA